MPPRLTGPALVGDHGDGLVQPVGPPIQRLELLARPGEAQGEVAAQLGGVEYVQRAAEVESEIVGDIDQRRDRPQADRLQAVLQPGRARPVAHPAHDPPDEQWARLGLVGGEVQRDRGADSPGRNHGREISRYQTAQARGREVARDAAHPEAVAAVGRELDLDHRPFETQRLDRRHANLGVGGQLDDAVVLLAQLELTHRAEHADAGHAPDHRLLQHLAGDRDDRAFGREHRLHAGARVGGAANHLEDTVPGLDGAQAQPVGIGMLAGLSHIGDAEGAEIRTGVGHALDLEAEHGQPVADRLQRGVGRQMLLEPGQRELHRDSPP